RISGPLCLPAVFPAVNLAVFRVFLLPLRHGSARPREIRCEFAARQPGAVFRNRPPPARGGCLPGRRYPVPAGLPCPRSGLRNFSSVFISLYPEITSSVNPKTLL